MGVERREVIQRSFQLVVEFWYGFQIYYNFEIIELCNLSA